MKRKPTWEVAYHFGLNRNVSIDEILKMRRGNDPRAGDLWCHKACYPNTGERLLSRDCSISNRASHFAKWKGENKFNSECDYFSFSRTRRETISYAQYYHDMRMYFSEIEKNTSPFMVSEIVFPSKISEPDLTIIHNPESGLGWSKTHLIIVDSNNKRAKKFRRNGHFVLDEEYYLVIEITELTATQLADFQRSGIERILLSWEMLLANQRLHDELKKQSRSEAEEQLKWWAEIQRKEREDKKRKILSYMEVLGQLIL